MDNQAIVKSFFGSWGVQGDGLIIRIDGYHDAGTVEAFVRLTRHREATNQNAPPLERPKAVRDERCR